MHQHLRIISRNSVLALWQANHFADKVKQHYPHMNIEISGISTKGDQILDRSLNEIGGKGLFIKELEQQLLLNKADVAIHSLKDLPANIADEFCLSAVLERDNPLDAFVSNEYSALSQMPKNSIIGTSSLRRSAILNRYYPDLTTKLLRGNLQTRLAKLDSGEEYNAIILASAGLTRLNLAHRITQILDPKKFMPSIGQGAIVAETLANRVDLQQLLKPLNHQPSFIAVSAERAMGKILSASCNVPIAGFCQIDNQVLHLSAMIMDKFSNKYLFAEATGSFKQYLELGQACAEKLIYQGALEIIEKYRKIE